MQHYSRLISPTYQPKLICLNNNKWTLKMIFTLDCPLKCTCRLPECTFATLTKTFHCTIPGAQIPHSHTLKRPDFFLAHFPTCLCRYKAVVLGDDSHPHGHCVPVALWSMAAVLYEREPLPPPPPPPHPDLRPPRFLNSSPHATDDQTVQCHLQRGNREEWASKLVFYAQSTCSWPTAERKLRRMSK